MNFYEVYEFFRKIFLFLSHIDLSFQKFFFHEVYKYFRTIFLFLSHIMIFHSL